MQAAFELALPLDAAEGEGVEIVDRRAEVERTVLARDDLRRISEVADRLTADQRLVLASQLAQDDPAAFCTRLGWSQAKYRKVAQRGRARLLQLIESRGVDVPGTIDSSEESTGTANEQIRSNS